MSTREEIESAVDIARRYRGVCESPKEIIAKEFGVTYFAVVKGMVRDATVATQSNQTQPDA